MLNRVLITGGSGLLALGWAIAIRDSHAVTLGLHRQQVHLAGVKATNISLQSAPDFIQNLKRIKPDLVIHTAGLANVDTCESDPTLAFHVNVDLADTVASSTYGLGIPLIHISTDHLSSGDKSFSREKDPVAPVNVYAKSKLEAEKKVVKAHPAALIVRTNFFGWGPAHRCSFSDKIIYQLRQNKRIFLFDDVFYTPILIEELAKTTHELHKKGAQGVINVVGSERISKYQFGCRIAQKFGLPSNLLDHGSSQQIRLAAARPKDMSLSNTLACEILGRNLGSIESYLERLLNQEQIGSAREINESTIRKE